MTSFNVTFKGSKQQMEQQALARCKFYLGEMFDEKAEVISGAIKSCKTRTGALRTTRFCCGMLGIQGRMPVRAMFRYCLDKQQHN